MFDDLTSLLSGSPWTYVVVLASIAGSAVAPVLPSESMIVTAGVLAGAGRLSWPLVLLAGALGAFVGDNLGYLLGRVVGGGAIRWVVRGERGERAFEWAQDALARHGGPLIVIDRFVPGGRTAVSIASGALAYPWPRYLLFSALGSAVWAVYGSLVGVLGGKNFRQDLWKGLVVALGVAMAVGVLVELARRWWERRVGSRA